MIEMQCVLLFRGVAPTEEEIEEALDCIVVEVAEDEVSPSDWGGSDG